MFACGIETIGPSSFLFEFASGIVGTKNQKIGNVNCVNPGIPRHSLPVGLNFIDARRELLNIEIKEPFVL